MKQRGKKKHSNQPVSYWQSTADMMSALLLILLLVIMLLLLYIIQIPEEEYVDSYPGSYSSSYSSSVASSDTDDDDWDGWDGGGWGGWGDGEDDYQYPTTGGGGGVGIGIGFGKTAVYVMVVDSETQATIKEAGVTFELYTGDGGIQFLNTYYPQRIEYRQYSTTDQGVFYLPEKIFQGQYYLHELTEPDGYDSAGNIFFSVNEDRDWDDPLVVTVPLSPSKNIIRIQMKDADTGEPVSGGVYDVVAAEDIITRDGTLRYSAGQTVDQITCDENGYGESMELYLGDYTLVQSTVPQYYAAYDGEPLEVSVEKKQNDVLPPIHQIRCEKTTVTIQVADELHPTTGLSNVTFRMTKSGVGTTTVEADANGKLVLTDLDKGVTYRLRQLTSADSYRFSTEDFVFTVSDQGLVEEEPQKEYTITNRLIRVEISVIDRVLRTKVSDTNVVLYDSNDQRLGMWDSSGLAQSLEGLDPGTYYLVLDGRTGRHIDFEVADTAAVQVINVPVWTLPGVGILTLIVAAAAALVALLVYWKKRHPGPHLPPPSAALRTVQARVRRHSRKPSAHAAGEPIPEQETDKIPVPAAGPASSMAEAVPDSDTEPADGTSEAVSAPDTEPVDGTSETASAPEAEPAADAPETVPASEAEPAADAPETTSAPEAEPAADAPETTSAPEAEPAADAPEATSAPEAEPVTDAPETVPASEAEPAADAPEETSAPEAEPAEDIPETVPASEAEPAADAPEAASAPEAEPADDVPEAVPASEAEPAANASPESPAHQKKKDQQHRPFGFLFKKRYKGRHQK